MGSVADQLDKCCGGLNSAKVTERKKSVELLADLIQKVKVIDYLNNNGDGRVSWDSVVRSLHWYLIKESEKLQEDERKTGCIGFYRKTGQDLLVNVVRQANKKMIRLNVQNLIEQICYCFDSTTLKKYFLDAYVRVLRDFILSQSLYYGQIDEKDWLRLLSYLKSFFDETLCEDGKIMNCLQLLLKWGPLHKLSLVKLRDEFSFITKLCLELKSTSPKGLQEAILNILVDFCNQNAKDCCMSCCKLGETVFRSLRDLYETRTNDNTVKDLLFDFFLLQVKLHHPYGSSESSPSAYAYSWSEWKKHLCSIYFIIQQEIHHNSCSSFKSNPLFNYRNEKRIQTNFSCLIVEVFKQVFSSGVENLTQISFLNESLDVTQPPSKRQRMEIGIQAIISNIQGKKSWHWINIMTELLKKYPSIIEWQDFLYLLNVLCSLQSECKDPDIQQHIYECLSVLIDVQKKLDNLQDQSELARIWSVVWESALRSAGLNQNVKATHDLLQKLLIKEKTENGLQVFQPYTSGVLTVTGCSLNTLNVASSLFGIHETQRNNQATRKTILNWILNSDATKCDSDVYAEPITAQVLISLCLKHWPPLSCSTDPAKRAIDFNNIEDVYMINTLENNLILPQNDGPEKLRENKSKAYIINKEIFDDLITLLQNHTLQFVDMNNDELFAKNLLNAVILVNNLLCFMLKYKIIENDSLDENIEKLNFVKLLSVTHSILLQYSEDALTKEDKTLISVIKRFKTLLSFNYHNSVSAKIREYLTEILKCLFNFMNADDDEQADSYTTTLRLLSLQTLCNFCFVRNSDSVSDVQEHALKALAEPNFNPCSVIDYEMAVTFMASIKNCTRGTLDIEVVKMILNSLQNICEARYTEYNPVLTVLEILYDLYPHVSTLECNIVKTQSVDLLEQFFELRDNYGPKVSVMLIKCMGQLAKLDPYEDWAKWSNQYVSYHLPELLKSNYQEVRLTAIKHILLIYSISDNNKTIFLKQKYIIDKVKIMSQEVFQIEGVLSEERTIDETVTRTASVLHTYGSLMSVSSAWRRKAVFSILQLVHERNLNSDLLHKLIAMVTKHLGMKDVQTYLEQYLDYLLDQWIANKLPLIRFPYNMLNCDESDFYSKYIAIIVPLLVQDGDLNMLTRLSIHIEKSVNEVVEVAYPIIIALYFLKSSSNNVSSKSADQLNNAKKMYDIIENILSSNKMEELLLSKINDVLISVIQLVFDVAKFTEQFDINYELPQENSSFFSFNCLTQTVFLIGKKLNIDDLIRHCILQCHDKVQNIMLQLTVNIYEKFGLEDKLKAMHHCALFVDLISPYLKMENNLREFLIRYVTYTLLHMINNNYKNYSLVNVAACKYLKRFCSKILPECANDLEQFLIVMVSTLTPIACGDSDISTECLNVLHFLIVHNVENFQKGIETLDPFPQSKKFTEINSVYLKVKYKRGDYDLKSEINHFLNTGTLMGNIGCRTDALRHLKTQLSSKKNELKILYCELENLRGFSEDCKDSILHQLVCSLLKLTASLDATVSVEASRCLGELGPGDLTTMILQSETFLTNTNSNPLHFLTAHVIKLLCEYIVDADILVGQVSSKALYYIMDTKEGQLFMKSNEYYNSNGFKKSYLTPFLTKRKVREDSQIELDDGVFTREIKEDLLWYPSNEHDSWIVELVCTLLKCFSSKSYLNKLIPVCRIKVCFSEQLLPHLIYLILHKQTSECVNIISTQLRYFFNKIWSIAAVSSQHDVINKSSVQCMLNIVHFIRIQESANSKKMGHLSLNYLKVAHAAYYCSSYFAALLYVELWSQTTILRLRSSGKSISSNLSMLDIICNNESEENCKVLQTILRETYSALGDLDALNGCGFTHLLDSKHRVDHYKQLEKWDQVVLHYDIQIAHGSKQHVPDLVNALKNWGLYHLASSYDHNKDNVDYESFWRLNQYYDNQNAQSNKHNGYEKYKYNAIKSLFDNDTSVFSESVTEARNIIIESLKHTSLESTMNLYNCLTQLQCLQELEDAHSAKENNSYDGFLQKLKEKDCIGTSDFKYIEPIKAQRISVLAGLVKLGHNDLKNSLIEFYLDLSGLARSEGCFNVAKRAIENLSLLPDLNDEYKGYKMFEEAQISWSMNDKPTGRYILHHLFNNQKENTRLYFASLNLYGKWMAETHSENAQTILTNYLLESLKVIKAIDKTQKDLDAISEAHDVIARFVDSEYQRIVAYIKSTEFERKVENMDKLHKKAVEIEKQSVGRRPSSDEKRAVLTYKRQSVIDKTEIESTYKEKDTYFLLAIKYYMLTLQHSNVNNTGIFRVLSLWLNNRTNTELPKLMNDNLPKIPSHKYVPILPQLVPHLSNGNEEDFGKQIYLILERCAKDHPHHTLPILLALAHSNKDDNYCKVVTSTESNEPRVLGAQRLITNLKKTAILKSTITQMERLSEALVELAYIDQQKCEPTRKKDTFAISGSTLLMKIKNFNETLLPTYTLTIKENCDYSNIIGIHSFGKEFTSCSGINAPKRITCRGTDGIIRIQLVKGQDDLRQDAVMQQVFNIINGLLRTNKQTSKLLIRTYKVVPISKRSGILEWVQNSVPLGEYLTNAHKTFNTGDWTSYKCRNEMKAVEKSNNDVKLGKYKDICKHFRPVMHKFFETNFIEPMVWYERRRAYMRSVATNSMSGYIVGLGDRHVHNILLDEQTAEVIHIDFGIAFEQGRVLPTPETVPFRLTRDIEDGMGVSGIEGLFRRSCEKTMEVLRQNLETITTIVEVLLYDPLYAWTVTPAQAYSRQFSSADKEDSSEPLSFSDEDKIPVNVTAERALLRLRQKLQGTEEGGTSSVEGQVEKLLQQARDPSHLSRIFHGWQPYF